MYGKKEKRKHTAMMDELVYDEKQKKKEKGDQKNLGVHFEPEGPAKGQQIVKNYKLNETMDKKALHPRIITFPRVKGTGILP